MLNQPKKRKTGLTYNEKDNRFVITFDSDISKAEFLEAWTRFEDARRKLTGKSHFTKRRPPKDIQLLLGVRFFKSFGATYKSIHEAYSNKQVPYYNGEYKFLTEFDLQKYYNRNIRKLKDI
jgi:hypothetical protein